MPAKLSIPIFMSATLLLPAPALHPVLRPARAQTALPATPGALVCVTGKTLSINGTTEIPRGLFGVHATKLAPENVAKWGVEAVRIIDQNPSGAPVVPGRDSRVPAGAALVECFYDRYQPARLLHDPNWQSNLAGLGKRYGEAAKNSGREHWVEFWNEPYLNWAARPGVNYDGAFYDRTDTTPGTPMTIKGAATPTPFLVWDAPKLVAVNPQTGAVDYLATRYLPDVIEDRAPREGDEWKFRGQVTRRLELRAWGRDTTQLSHYSASQNALYYNQMFGPFARALKAANPDVKIIAGWGCHLQYDNWRGWDLLYKPLLDEHHELMDGLNEHHYGGDTRMVAGAYETVAAYAATKWNKTLKFYNTEAGGMLDPEQPGTSGKPTFIANNRAELEASMTYTLRDVLHLLAACPDKAVTRFAHEADANGDRFALELLQPLRGQLLETLPPSSRLWSVATRNGNELVLALWNDGRNARNVNLQMAAPAGFTLGAATRREVVTQGESLRVIESPFDARGAVQIGPRRAVVLRFGLTPILGALPIVRSAKWTQFYGPQILQKVEPGGVATVSVEVPAAALKNAKRARLRWVVEGQNAGVRAKWNGIALPVGESSSFIHDEIVDLASLRERNELEISCAPDAPGFQLDAASLFLEG